MISRLSTNHRAEAAWNWPVTGDEHTLPLLVIFPTRSLQQEDVRGVQTAGGRGRERRIQVRAATVGGLMLSKGRSMCWHELHLMASFQSEMKVGIYLLKIPTLTSKHARCTTLNVKHIKLRGFWSPAEAISSPVSISLQMSPLTSGDVCVSGTVWSACSGTTATVWRGSSGRISSRTSRRRPLKTTRLVRNHKNKTDEEEN